MSKKIVSIVCKISEFIRDFNYIVIPVILFIIEFIIYLFDLRINIQI